jgi:hypothetical protein
MVSRRASMTGCLALAACLGDPPQTHVSDLDPVCEGTEPGHACITLVPSATESVKDELGDDDSEGSLSWALYEDGDVGALGPDDRDDYVIAGEHVVDLAEDPEAGAVTIVDFDPGWFQVMAYFRPLPLEEPGKGDALTLPTSGFEAPADAHTTVEVVLDHVR